VTVAYLVVSHRNPEQVLRLVAALREGPSSEVVVRHDDRRSHLPQAEVEDLGAHLLDDGIEVDWGSFSYLRMLLAALEWMLERLDPDWLLVLSGQDYPIRPLAEVEAFLEAAAEDAFLGSAWQLDTTSRPGPRREEFFLRYAYRHYAVPRSTPRPPNAVRRLLYARDLPGGLGRRLGVRRVRLPFGPGLRCYVSTDWLTLSRRAAVAVTEHARDEPGLMRFWRRTIIPSEAFFATALLNDPALHIARWDRRFVLFPGPEAPHPEVLRHRDLDRLLASDAYFARKFDATVDGEVLDELDRIRRAGQPR
jgi:hypothetical protein